MSSTIGTAPVDSVVNSITAVVGPDWGNPRARVYIAVEMQQLRQAVAELSEELKWEREVNRRVLEVFKAGFGIKTDA